MKEILCSLGVPSVSPGGFGKEVYKGGSPRIDSFSPIDNSLLASVDSVDSSTYEKVITDAHEAFLQWRVVPAPERGELVRKIGMALRSRKKELGQLVTAEMGKILSEGEGEIQEAIDIADFAVGLSRQLYGKTMHSERRRHRMYEQWHPLGVVGVITAFNFPAAVWAWNAMIAAVCGNSVVWKPSELTPLTAVAVIQICREVATSAGFPGLFTLVNGGREVGEWMAADKRIPLISATGSCRMGRAVGQVVAQRFGRSLLELGGNNAVVILKDANLDLVVRSVAFGAAGTAGQRCTSIRRVLVDEAIADEFQSRLVRAYKQIKVGDPLKAGTLMGPLINKSAVDTFDRAVRESVAQGGSVVCGGEHVRGMPSDLYVQPTIVRSKKGMQILQEENFVPVVHIVPIRSLDEGIEVNNSVPQGLSSAVYTTSLLSAEQFLSAQGSDCGIANVNIGTSGAEIGGAFGGEKETGGGREAGSDSWKQYMRRQTVTINCGNDLPLAQGIKFDIT